MCQTKIETNTKQTKVDWLYHKIVAIMTLTAILSLVFLLLSIAFIVVSLIFLRPRVKTVFTTKRKLQENFDHGTGVLQVQNISKPFSITGYRSAMIKNAVTYSDAKGTITFVGTTACNSFQVTTNLRVTSLQILAGFIGQDAKQPTRNVYIYDLDSRKLLISNAVSRDDDIVNGFHTHIFEDFTQRLVLVPGVNYAICATVMGLVGDMTSMGKVDNVQPSAEIFLTGSTTLVESDDIFNVWDDIVRIPDKSDFENIRNNLVFASFQFQIEPVVTSLFDVDIISGFATFPPKYIHNLSIEVLPTALYVYNGVCIDQTNAVNIVNDTAGSLRINPTSVGVPNALDTGTLENNQWYAIHIVASNDEKPTCAILSKNQEDPMLPLGYAFNRRIGYCRTRTNGTFWMMTSTGSGQRRRQFYPLPYPEVMSARFTVNMITNKTPLRIKIDLIPPTSTSCTLQMEVINPNARSVQLFMRQIDAIEPQNFFYAPPSETTQTIQRLAINTAILPPSFEIYASSEYSLGDGIDLKISIQSFFVDVN